MARYLVDLFEEAESNLVKDKQQIERLKDRGHTIEKRSISYANELEPLLEQFPKDNPYVARLLQGEDPEIIYNEVVEKRKWSMKLPGLNNFGRRQNFNDKVKALNEIAQVHQLETRSIFSFKESEGSLFWSICIGLACGFGLNYLAEYFGGPNFLQTYDPTFAPVATTITGVVIGWGSAVDKCWSSRVKKARDSFTKGAEYIRSKIIQKKLYFENSSLGDKNKE